MNEGRAKPLLDQLRDPRRIDHIFSELNRS